MDRFTIKEIEQFSGIRAHTIRIWEKRYGIIEPSRTETNIRYYTGDDLRKILNISLLNKNGLKISKIVELSEKQIADKIFELEKDNNTTFYRDRLVLCMVNFDEGTFNQVFSECLTAFGFKQTFVNIIFPFLTHVGTLWGNKEISPAQEHFISNVIRSKLYHGIDQLSFPPKQTKPFVLFLALHETHDISLLFLHYVLKEQGIPVIYLGTNVPTQSVKELTDKLEPQGVATIFTITSHTQDDTNFLLELSDIDNDLKVLYSGNIGHINKDVLPNNCMYFSDLQNLNSILG